VVDLTEAVAFYERAGFGVRSHTEDNGDAGEGSRSSTTTARACSTSMPRPTWIRTPTAPAPTWSSDDPKTWHARTANAGLEVTPLADQPWGMRELSLTDPSGNHVRIGRSIPDG
jgi:hypothetical protein